jgi:hypothetical protein
MKDEYSTWRPCRVYPRGNCQRYSLDGRLNGPQSRYRSFWEKKPCPARIRNHTVQLVASRYTAWAILLGVFDWWLSLQPPAHAGCSLADFSTLKMEAIRSSETSVYAISTRRRIPEDGFFIVTVVKTSNLTCKRRLQRFKSKLYLKFLRQWLKSANFWVVTLCSSDGDNRSFGENYSPLFWMSKISPARNQKQSDKFLRNFGRLLLNYT